MNIYTNDRTIQLQAMEILSTEATQVITCVSGVLWITWMNGEKILQSGEELQITGLRLCLVMALCDSRLSFDMNKLTNDNLHAVV